MRTTAGPALLAAILALPAVAQPPPDGPPAATDAAAADAEAVVRHAVDQVLAVLRDPAMQAPTARAQRIERIRAIVDGVFDWNAMARSSLGVYWRRLDEAQRQRFVAVFRDVLAAEYVNDFDRFRGDERVEFNEVEQEGDTRVVETTLVTHSRERVPIHYYLHRTPKGGWAVHDFSVEGISIVNHYRGSFSRYLTNHSFEELMQTLERRRRVLHEATQPSLGG